jgi:hypothetical protein
LGEGVAGSVVTVNIYGQDYAYKRLLNQPTKKALDELKEEFKNMDGEYHRKNPDAKDSKWPEQDKWIVALDDSKDHKVRGMTGGMIIIGCRVSTL